MQPPKALSAKSRDARLRTRVIRFLRDEVGPATLPEIAKATGLSADEVRRGIEHNLYVDSLRKGLYHGVIQKVEDPEGARFQFNRGQYRANRRAWHAAREQAGADGLVGSFLRRFLRGRKGRQ